MDISLGNYWGKNIVRLHFCYAQCTSCTNIKLSMILFNAVNTEYILGIQHTFTLHDNVRQQ